MKITARAMAPSRPPKASACCCICPPMSKLKPGGSTVSFISFCTSAPTSPALRPSTPANTASRRCRFCRRMISGLNTDSMVATLSSAIGVPSLA